MEDGCAVPVRADPRFPVGGDVNPDRRQHTILPNFPQKYFGPGGRMPEAPTTTT